MEKYNELIKTLENYKDASNDSGHAVLTQTAQALELLQSAVSEKQKLLEEALGDLAKDGDCKYCAHINECRLQRIERNMAYGGCAKWEWRGAKKEEMAS